MLSLTSPIKTIYHRIPAVPKLLLLCCFTCAVFLIRDPVLLVAAVLLAGALHFAPGIRFLLIAAKRLLPILPFLAVILVWHLATGDHEAGLIIGLRLTSAVAVANLVTMTTRLDELAEVAGHLARPLGRFGISSKTIGLSVALVVRFTPVLLHRAGLLIESWRSRAASRPAWRILVPLSSIALDDADRVAEALKARGGV